eukprot:c9890_g1_i2.p1 GENE.c9890_g1_i2~~c9890_g1_i2.p1  ORF type:complete len:581 (+),score=116.48 c9890_g1_i2:937-2679(+)
MWVERHNSIDLLTKQSRSSNGSNVFLNTVESNTSIQVLSLLCLACSRELVVLDDDQFLTSGKPLSRDELKKFSRQLLLLCIRLIQTNVSAQTNQFLSRAIKLLHQIHERDCRLHFCEPSHWLVLEVDPIATVNEFKERARQVNQANDLFPSQMVFHPEDNLTMDDDVVMGTSNTQNDRFVSQRFQKILTILRSLPFVVPFEARVKMFRILVDFNEQGGYYHNAITVRRDHLYDDAYDKLAAAPSETIKEQLSVRFLTTEGVDESGIGPGVVREFLQDVIREAFDPQKGLFVTTDQHVLYPNPNSLYLPHSLSHFEFIGRLIGKVLLEKQLVDIPLSRFFLNHVLCKPNSLSDLLSRDAEMHKNLMYILNCDPAEVESLYLFFSVSRDRFGVSQSIDLKPNGASIQVTAENRVEYVYQMAHYLLNVELRAQQLAFIKGLSDLVPIHWLRMFSPEELQMLISGTQQDINVDDLEQNVVYNGYTVDSPVIRYFWTTVREMTGVQRKQLLRFITSSDRAPLLGFAHLNPKICIHKSIGVDNNREWLPTSATCMHILKLPDYPNQQMTTQKILYAISQARGFQLT